MFEVEKPRQFHYEPRFYDPEKERWEALKKKYAIEQEKKEGEKPASDAESNDLHYFQQRVRDLDNQDHAKASHLSWRDLFRKRKMPQFNYRPRFGSEASAATTTASAEGFASDDVSRKYATSRRKIKIKRRFDISDTEYMKPVSGTKIILYCFVVFLLITLILKF